MKKIQKGFTLIELLVVILIISILAVTVFVALNPVARFKAARDSRRWVDVTSILTAVHEYIVDNNGTMPAGILTSESQLGTAASGCNTACPGANAACVNLSTTLGAYLKTMPKDPLTGTDATTNYKIVRDVNGIVTVSACASETAGVQLSVSR